MRSKSLRGWMSMSLVLFAIQWALAEAHSSRLSLQYVVGGIMVCIWDPPTQPSSKGKRVPLWLPHLQHSFCHMKLENYTRKDKIQIFRSVQNFVIPISENPVNSYDSDGVILIFISALGSEKWHLLVFCLHTLPWNPLDVSGCIICSWKDILKGNTMQLESWEMVQWRWSYLKNKFDK